MTSNTIHLPSVTLFGIDAHDPEGLLRAAEICQRVIKFGAVEMITERLFSGREAYSRFCIERMNEYVNTSHVLIIHADGYVAKPEAWNAKWLQYDYIGGVWDWYNEYQVGNGGFSLRSKKLLQILSSLDLTGIDPHPEDDVICRQLRPWLEKKCGIRFAPVEVAKKFSIEGYGLRSDLCRYKGEFGFHGYDVRGLPIPPIRKHQVRQLGTSHTQNRRAR